MAPLQAGTPGETPTGTPGETPTGNATDTWVSDLEFLPPVVADFLNGLPAWFVEVGLSVLVLVVAYFVSDLLVQLLSRRVARYFRRPSLTRTVLRSVRFAVFIVAFLVILTIFGYELGNIVLPLTVLTAVVGVVLAPIVGSVISGMFLLADQPYEIGDMIEFSETDQRGFVEDITIRYTKIFTLDNTFLVIPNGTMRERDVVNYSAEDTRVRRSIDVLVTYESDVQRARDLLEDAARDVDGVVEGGPQIRVGAARYPAGPVCYIENFADHGVLLRLRYWIDEPFWLLRMRSKIQTAVWDAIADEDVEIAYPHSHQVFDETSGTMEVSLADSDADDASATSHRREGTDRSMPDRNPRTRSGPDTVSEESSVVDGRGEPGTEGEVGDERDGDSASE